MCIKNIVLALFLAATGGYIHASAGKGETYIDPTHRYGVLANGKRVRWLAGPTFESSYLEEQKWFENNKGRLLRLMKTWIKKERKLYKPYETPFSAASRAGVIFNLATARDEDQRNKWRELADCELQPGDLLFFTTRGTLDIRNAYGKYLAYIYSENIYFVYWESIYTPKQNPEIELLAEESKWNKFYFSALSQEYQNENL